MTVHTEIQYLITVHMEIQYLTVHMTILQKLQHFTDSNLLMNGYQTKSILILHWIEEGNTNFIF